MSSQATSSPHRKRRTRKSHDDVQIGMLTKVVVALLLLAAFALLIVGVVFVLKMFG